MDGIRYSKDHTIYLNSQNLHDHLSVQTPFNPQELIVNDANSSELAGKLEMMCSAAYYRCYRGDNSVNDNRLATGFDHHTPPVDKGSSRQVQFNVLEASVNSNTSAAHVIDVLSEPETGSLFIIIIIIIIIS